MQRQHRQLRRGRSHRNFAPGRFTETLAERRGTTPFNLLPLTNGGQPGQRSEHPAATAKTLADWWRRYILPRDGVLPDPFCGSGQTLASGLDCGAVEVEREAKYLDRRVKAI